MSFSKFIEMLMLEVDNWSDWAKYHQKVERSRKCLLELDNDTKLKVLGKFIRNSNVDLYGLIMSELHNSTHKPLSDDDDDDDRTHSVSVSFSVDREGSKKNGVVSSCSVVIDVDDDDGERSPFGKSVIIPKGKRSMRENIKCCKNISSVIVPVDQISEVEATMTKKPTKIRWKLKPPDQSFVSKPARFSVDRDYGDEIKKMVQKSEKVCSKQPRHDGDYSDDVEKGTAKKRRMIEKVTVVPPELPAKFKNYIERLNGTELNFVIEKPLYRTDLSHTHGRLSLPLCQIDNGFLTQEEKDLLNTRTGNHKTPIEAKLIEPSGHDSDICLKKWDMPKKSNKVSTTYNLTTSWNRVVKNNRLREGMIVQLWSFRVGSKLWFALVKVKRN
ncbi:hypothetical protein CsSME_00051300 [Camellia sinensis var. sinensis]